MKKIKELEIRKDLYFINIYFFNVYFRRYKMKIVDYKLCIGKKMTFRFFIQKNFIF